MSFVSSGRWLIVLFVMAVSLPAIVTAADGPVAAGGDRVFRAGAAAIDISPTKFPVFVAGMFTARTADRVHQPIYARCIVLDDGQTRVAMVVVDLVKIWRDVLDPVREAASKATGIPVERIMISATHTHSAPGVAVSHGTPISEEYKQSLHPLLVEVIERANANLEPAQVGWTVVEAPEYTHNRRWIYRSDRMISDPFGQKTVRANMHPGFQSPNHIGPSGPVDADLSILAFRSPAGRPIAVFANYSQHYFGATPVSSDYFGLFVKKVEAAMMRGQPKAQSEGRPCVAIMSQGTSGDLMWRDYSRPQERLTLDRYSQAVADRALEGIARITYHDWAPVAMRQTSIKATIRKPDEARLEWAKAKLQQMGDRLPKDQPEVYATHVVRLNEGPGEAEVVLQAIRVGELAITATPAEVFAITGLRIKAQSPMTPTFNVTQANHGHGYVPPPEQHSLGGYTTWPAFGAGLAPDTESKIVEAHLSMLEALSGQQRRPIAETGCDYSRAVLASGPAGYWRLGDMTGTTARDYSGKDRPAVVEPGVAYFLTGPEGKGITASPRGNRCMHTAGGRIKTDAGLLRDAFSIELWFWNGFPLGVREVAGHLLSAGPDGEAGQFVSMSGSGPTAGRLHIGGDKQRIDGKTAIAWRTWNHLVLVREGKQVRLYLNGEIEANAELLPLAAERPLVFLGGRGDSKIGWEGKIDEPAVYDRALAPDEIQKHYRAAGVGSSLR